MGRPRSTDASRADERIDLGLALLTCLCRPGVPLADEDIAAWCGCSREKIGMIAQRALRKLRRRLLETIRDEPQMREALDAFFGRRIAREDHDVL